MNVNTRYVRSCNYTLNLSENRSLTNIVQSSSLIKIYWIASFLRSFGWSLKGRMYFIVSMFLNDQKHFPIVSIQFLLLLWFNEKTPYTLIVYVLVTSCS